MNKNTIKLVIQFPTSAEAFFQSSLHKNEMKKNACSETAIVSPVHSPVVVGDKVDFMMHQVDGKRQCTGACE